MPKLKVFKKLQETSEKLVAMDILDEDSSSGPSGSGLPTYPVAKSYWALNSDMLTFSIFDNLENITLSKGKLWYDIGFSLPTPPNQTVDNGLGRAIALWSYDDGSTVQYEWTYGPEFDLMAITPPLNFGSTSTEGAALMGFGICINLSGSTKTIGVDAFDEAAGRQWNRIEAIYEGKGANTNPGYFLAPGNTGAGEIRNNVGYEIYDFYGGGSISDGSNPDDSYCNGTVIPDGETVDFRIIFAGNDPRVVPSEMKIQGVLTLCNCAFTNNTGSDWTWGADPLVALDCEFINVIPGEYIGEYNDLIALAAGGLKPSKGQEALVGGVLYKYLQGTWVAQGSGGSDSFAAIAGYDFSNTGTTIKPVRFDSFGDIVPLFESLSGVAAPTNGATGAVDVCQVPIDNKTMIEFNNVDVGGGIYQGYASVFKYDIDNGNWSNLSGAGIGFGASQLSGVKKISAAKIDSDIVSCGWISTTGAAYITLFKIVGVNLEILWETEVFSADITEFKVFTGTILNYASNWNPYDNIVFAGADSNLDEFFVGRMLVNNNRQSPTVGPVNYIASITAADAVDFSIDGLGWGYTTTGAMLLLKSGDIHYIDIQSGTIQGSNTLIAGPISAFRIRLLEPTNMRFAIAFLQTTTETYYTTCNFDGLSVNVYVPSQVEGVNVDKVTTPYSIDIVPTQRSCCTVVTINNDTGVKSFEVYLMELNAGYIPSSVVIDNASISADMGTTEILDVQLLREQITTFDASQLIQSIAYINNNSERGAAVLSAFSPTNILTAWNSMPQWSQCVGVIDSNPTISTSVTVYTSGAKIAAQAPFSNEGDIVYGNYDGESLTINRGVVQFGEVIDGALLRVDIRPTATFPWMTRNSPSLPTDPINAIYFQTNRDTKALPWGYSVPINLNNIGGVANVAQLSVIGLDQYNHTINPGLNGLSKYLSMASIGDSLSIQMDRDTANTRSGYPAFYFYDNNYTPSANIVYQTSETMIRDTDTMKVPVQYKGSRIFNLGEASPTDLNRIYGMDIGAEFTIVCVNADITVGLLAGGTGGGGAIISNSRRSSITLATGDYIVCKVLDTYEIQIVQYVVDGEIVDLEAPASILVPIPSADVLTLNSVPFQLLPAPGVNKSYEIYNVYGELVYNTTPYDTNTQLAVVYAGQPYSSGIFWNNNLLAESSTIIKQFTQQAGVIVPNTAVNLLVNTGNPATGDSDLDVYITYKIINI